jgi:Predicted RNA-binding protein homologous to eukaryotic snRNP
MAINSKTLSCLINELQACINTRVEKIYQSGKSTLCFLLRSKDFRGKLVVSASGQTGRICLTEAPPEFPDKPPMFCMLMRKYLVGARISSIEQHGGEMIAVVNFDGTTDLGESTTYTLVIELFAGGNIILLDAFGKIIDCSSRKGLDKDRVILPGIIYTFPPSKQFDETPTQPLPDGFDTYNSWVDKTLGEAEKAAAFKSLYAELNRLLSNLSGRIDKKIEVRLEEMINSEGRDRYKEIGDLITANIHNIPPKAGQIIVRDFYTDEERVIELDKSLTPSANAQKYYKKYKKLVSAQNVLVGLIDEAKAEAAYIETVSDVLSRADTVAELSELKAELVESGYIRKARGSGKKQKALEVLAFTSPDGFTVLCGRNNVQNDRLTFKTAKNRDIWCHVKDYPGSHVIILCENGEIPPISTIEYACGIAAGHSKAKDGENVAVDWTYAKYVKKPAGAKPGFVIYTNQKTLNVEPII